MKYRGMAGFASGISGLWFTQFFEDYFSYSQNHFVRYAPFLIIPTIFILISIQDLESKK